MGWILIAWLILPSHGSVAMTSTQPEFTQEACQRAGEAFVKATPALTKASFVCVPRRL